MNLSKFKSVPPAIPQELIDNPLYVKEQVLALQEILANNPGVNDVYATQQWLAEFRVFAMDMVIIYGKLKAMYTRFSVELLTNTSTEDYKKFCNTEQKCEDYVYAHFPFTEDLMILKPLVEKYYPQVSSEYITLISASKKQASI